MQHIYTMFTQKIKLGVCIGAALLCSSTGYARQLSLEEAMQLLPEKFISPSTRSASNLIYTEKENDLNVAYVLSTNSGNGYVVVSADDLLPSVLGYSDNGRFDPAAIPPAMASWLESYGRQLSFSIENGVTKAQRASLPQRDPVAPLCSALWNQSAPFNNLCPEISGKHTPSGCTATAMAQVLYAHKWPVTGVGVNSYISAATRQKLTFDFGGTTFDWGNMLPDYQTGYTPEQGNAVATLMLACGNATLMSYDSDASGAYPYNAVYGMVKFLRYDKSAVMLERDYYSSELWNDIVYSELANKRPVIYGGYTSTNDGHTFIVDGYNGNGYFHLNWGWGGMSNGYFLLTALDPAEQGIGGSSSGYNFMQQAIINVMPEKENSDYTLEVMWHGPFTTANKAYSSKGEIEFTAGKEGYFRVFTLADINATMGVILTPQEGGDGVFYPGNDIEFKSYYGGYDSEHYSGFTVPVASLPKNGSYVVTPAFKVNGELRTPAIKVGESSSVILTCQPMGVKIEDSVVERTLTANNIKLQTPLYSGKFCKISADVHNSGVEYLGTIKAGFVNSEGSVLSWLDDAKVNLTDGETVTVNFSGQLVSYTQDLPAGDYIFNIFDENNESICPNPINVTVKQTPEGKPVFSTEYKVTGSLSGEGSNINPYLVADKINLDLTIDVTSGVFDDLVALYPYYENDVEANFGQGSVSTNSYLVEPGSSQTLRYTLDTSSFQLDKNVYIQAYGWTYDYKQSSGWIGRKLYFKRVESGISDAAVSRPGVSPNPVYSTTTVTASTPVKQVEIYSLTGMKVSDFTFDGSSESVEINVDGLPAGHYILLVKTLQSIESFRMIKK